MESIYYVLSWACHRKCVHCYEDRFRPYVRDALEEVVAEAERNMPRIVGNLPERMTYIDPEQDNAERIGRIILAGGEVLLDPVRERVLYPALERIVGRYRNVGGVKVSVQTTGDLLTPQIIADLVRRGIWSISVAGMDDFHVGMEGTKRDPLKVRLETWFAEAGMKPAGYQAGQRKWHDEDGPLYSFFGATPEAWIGKLWPRGRAWSNGLSKATMADNFCNRWSGGLGFLNHRYAGSEVAIDPSGDVYPCCMKTKAPVGNLTEEPLIGILDSLVGHPAFEAINMGHPERMGLAYGRDIGGFYEACTTVTPKGEPYRNLCIGCDRFHEEILAPVIGEMRSRRLALRQAAE